MSFVPLSYADKQFLKTGNSNATSNRVVLKRKVILSVCGALSDLVYVEGGGGVRKGA